MATATPSKRNDAGHPRDTAIRYLNMLSLIPLEPRHIGTRELTSKLAERGHPVDTRTVQRDLQNLSRLFKLGLLPGTGREQRWYFCKGSPAHWPAMDLDTALAVTLAEQDLHRLLPQQIMQSFDCVVQQAKSTLNAQDAAGKRSTWANNIRIVPSAFAPQVRELAPDVLTVVYDALGLRRQLHITRDGKTSVVNPLGLVMRGSVLYLVSTYEGYQDIRITALHRIQHAERLPGNAVIPPGFHLDTVLAEGILQWRLEPGKPKAFEVHASASAASYFAEHRVNDSQTLSRQKDGSTVVRFTTEDTLALRQWLLGFAAEIEVRKPAAVKNWFASTVQALAAKYTPRA